MTRLPLLWPLVIVLSALAAGLVNFVTPDTAGRPIIVMGFLFICPGMALVRFFRLNEPIAQWSLAIALSFSLEALVAGIQMYTGRWSPPTTLMILIGLCLISATTQATLAFHQMRGSGRPLK